MSKNLFLLLLFCCFGAGQLNAQDAANDRKAPARAGIDLLGGAMLFSENPSAATVIGVNVWTTLNSSDNSSRLRWSMILELPLWRRPPMKDPFWRDMGPIIFWPPFPVPPDPDPWTNFPLSQVRFGRTLIVSPSLGLRFGGDRLTFQVFGGGGFQHTQARSSEIRGLTYRTTDTTSPLLTYGATARYNLTDGISAKIEFRALKTFDGNLSLIGPDGSVALFEAMDMTLPMLSAGIGIGLR